MRFRPARERRDGVAQVPSRNHSNRPSGTSSFLTPSNTSASARTARIVTACTVPLRSRASAPLETERFDVNVIQTQLAHGLAKERGLSDACLDQRQAHVRPHDLQRQRRRSAAGSDVDDHAIAIAHVGRGKNRLDDQSVDRVIRRAIEVERRQIDAAIPAGEEASDIARASDAARASMRTPAMPRRAWIACSKSNTAIPDQPLRRVCDDRAPRADRDGGRRHAGHARGLTDRRGPHGRQPLDDLTRETGNAAVFEVGRNRARFAGLRARVLRLVLTQIAAIPEFRFERRGVEVLLLVARFEQRIRPRARQPA